MVAQQYKCHSEMVTMVNTMLCEFYHNKNKMGKNGRKACNFLLALTPPKKNK